MERHCRARRRRVCAPGGTQGARGRRAGGTRSGPPRERPPSDAAVADRRVGTGRGHDARAFQPLPCRRQRRGTRRRDTAVLRLAFRHGCLRGGTSRQPNGVPACGLPKNHTHRRAVGGAGVDRRRRGTKAVREGDDDRLGGQRTIRGQRSDDQTAPAPALRGTMSGSTTQFTVPAVADAVASAIGDREFIIHGNRRYTYAQIVERSNRLAAYLHSRGLGCHTERSELAGHEVGQDLLGIYAYNGPEYVEAMLGAWRARVAPFNVNYRYVQNELHYLLADSAATALIYHAAFAPRVADVLPDLPRLRVLIQIADDSGNDLVHGAVDYESIVASGPVQLPPVEPSPDDLYVLYTGGTTGMPKGVLWRQHDIFMTSFGGRSLYTGELANTYDEIVKRCLDMPAGTKLMILPPLMHGAAQWAAMTAMTTGQSVVFSTATGTFDADEVVRTIEREKVLSVTVVGDAMARPLAAAIERDTADVSSLAV